MLRPSRIWGVPAILGTLLVAPAHATASATTTAPVPSTAAYVANRDGTVSVVDLATQAITATIAVGGSPFDVALSPDRSRAYVANHGNSPYGVDVIDTATNTVTAVITISGPAMEAAVHPAGTRVYTANRLSGKVSLAVRTCPTS